MVIGKGRGIAELNLGPIHDTNHHIVWKIRVVKNFKILMQDCDIGGSISDNLTSRS